MSEGAADKAAIRTAARAARQALSPAWREAASRAIADRVLALPEAARACTVLAYAALAEEADPAALVTELRARGVRTALPTVAGPGVLTLSWVDAATPLVPGPFGIGQPATGATFASPDDFDLVIVPGLAFDRNCRRIGFGGGFYDALLPTLRPGALAVGIAFDEQLIDRVPCEAHDVPVDVVVTPGGVFRRGD